MPIFSKQRKASEVRVCDEKKLTCVAAYQKDKYHLVLFSSMPYYSSSMRWLFHFYS